MLTPWPRTRGERTTEQWTAQVFNPDGTPGVTLPLDDKTAPRLTWGQAESPLGATITIIGAAPDLTGGQTVRLTYSFDEVTHHLPLLVPTKDTPLYDLGEWCDLELIDPTNDYAADGIDFPLVLPAGTVIVTAARAVLERSKPGAPVLLPDLDLTLRNLLDYAIGTDPLLIFNELMEALGCTNLAPTLEGPLQASPWVPPADRPVRMHFGPAEVDAGYMPAVRTPTDYLATPNVAHYEAAGSSTSDQLTGRWRDEDPASRWSIHRRRKRVYAPKGRGEAANQQIADLQAMRIGVDSPTRGRTATLTGGFQPVYAGHIVTTEHPDHPALSARWEVMQTSVTGSLSTPTVWTLKEIV